LEIALFVIRRKFRLWFRCVINPARIVESRHIGCHRIEPALLEHVAPNRIHRSGVTRIRLRERCLGLTGEYTNLIGRDTL